MAALTWYCPVGGCPVRDRRRPGTCPTHITQLIRERAPEPEPEPVVAPSPMNSAALECPWGTVDIPADELLVGREAPAFRGGPIRTYDQISRRHARLFWRDGDLHVEDLGSSNGTYVDEEQVRPGGAVAVGPGRRLRLGLDVPFRIVVLNEFGEPV